MDDDNEIERVAIIGMAGKFPGAGNIDTFWQNLRNGSESITRFTDDELRAAGVPDAYLRDPSYVKAGALIDDVDCFDAGFFGYNPREASQTDPQQRLFLESSWAALEDAGYNPDHYPGAIGVFAGAGANTYARRLNYEPSDPINDYQQMIGNENDFLATRVAYKLNLRGQSLTVQTACSTSLVAIHLAAQSLLTYQCDMTLAGGVSLWLPQGNGYFYREGMILSPDGHCRAFDARGRGIVGGRGVGIVVLKRLSDALQDGDNIRAVLKGSAVNNDGAEKIGYTAPSIDGQAEVISVALDMSDVDPDSVSYIEAHGTGTELGDPIEVAALTAAFRRTTQRTGYCGIGSVKSNIGHLDAAAGVTGFIKTVLALEHGEIPPTLHFDQPNPAIDFESSPFFVNTELKPWVREGDNPLRAGVSSFGIGGTNAHAVLEEAPTQIRAVSEGRCQLFVTSGKTELAADNNVQQLSKALANQELLSLRDAAYTLQVGRKHFSHRRIVVGNTSAELGNTDNWSKSLIGSELSSVAFMFSGQGSQYVGMSEGLYQHQPVFRAAFDRCMEIVTPYLEVDIRSIIFPSDKENASFTLALQSTAIAQPALFSVEYALSELWQSVGVKPDALIGHSIGEYTAATVAGIFDLESALKLVAVRGRLMQQLPAGSMLAVACGSEDPRFQLPDSISIAAINSPFFTVVSGESTSISAFQKTLNTAGINSTELHTSHAFHSAMMDPILNEFKDVCVQLRPQPPSIPIVSNLTGTWLTDQQAADPHYWAEHLRGTVQFAKGIQQLSEDPNRILLELGPGNTLASLAKQSCKEITTRCLSTLPSAKSAEEDESAYLKSAGKLWLQGIELDWEKLYPGESPKRVSLPTYAFERTRYWIEDSTEIKQSSSSKITKLPKIEDWFWVPSWRRESLLSDSDSTLASIEKTKPVCLVFINESTLSQELIRLLPAATKHVITVRAGELYQENSDYEFTIDSVNFQHYQRLLERLKERSLLPDVIAHIWTVGELSGDAAAMKRNGLHPSGINSVIPLVQALHRVDSTHTAMLSVVTAGAHDVIDEVTSPGNAPLTALLKSIAQEYAALSVRALDTDALTSQYAAKSLLQDILRIGQSGDVIAYRSRHRWVQSYQQVHLPKQDKVSVFRQRGVYLITGGVGGVGRILADYLAKQYNARLVLVSRNPFNPKDEKGLDDVFQQREFKSEVLMLKADVCDLKQMSQVVAEVEQRFGKIDGVFHAAGAVPSTGSSVLQTIGQDTIEQQLSAKVEGVHVLSELFENRKLDFCMLTSSISVVLGGIGLGIYAAANSYMDAFVLNRNKRIDQRWITVNLDAWYTAKENINHAVGMSRTEGVEAIVRALSNNLSDQIIVSTAPLESRLAKWVSLESEAEHSNTTQIGADETDPSKLKSGTPEEEILRAIWKELLGIEYVGLHDNYFELGGDSLRGMSVVSRANAEGLSLTPQQLLDHPTIAQLAFLSKLNATKDSDSPASHSGELANARFPLTPNFLRYLSRDTSLNHWNVSVLLYSPAELGDELLERAVEELENSHETLRLRFTNKNGNWERYIVEPGSNALPISYHDLSRLNDDQRLSQLHEIAEEVNSGFDLNHGPLYHIAEVDLGSSGNRLLLVCHHFIAEGFSLGILCDDLSIACDQLSNGLEVTPFVNTASIRSWAQEQQALADSDAVQSQVTYWCTLDWSSIKPIPADFSDSPSALQNKSASQVMRSLGENDTKLLLTSHSVNSEELLIAAFAGAYASWSGQSSLLMDRIGHGRSSNSTHFLDVSRSAGFFLSYTPLLINNIQPEQNEQSGIISNIKAFLKRGEEFDLLRWMSTEDRVKDELASLPVPQISFNYRGRLDNFLAETSIFEIAPENLGKHVHNPEGKRYYPLSVVADVAENKLNIRIVFSQDLHHSDSMESLADAYIESLNYFLQQQQSETQIRSENEEIIGLVESS